MTNEIQDIERNEEQLAMIIRHGGARSQPLPEVREAVREAAFAEWNAVVAERRARQQRRVRFMAAAAVIAVVSGVAWLSMPLIQPGPAVAAIERIEGRVEISTGGLLSGFASAPASGQITQGSEIRSLAGGRMALRAGDASVRLDEGTSIVFLASDRIELKAGALYVDSGSETAGTSSLMIETPFGTVEHLGTQYETRLADRTLRVRVREGRVRVGNGAQAVEGRAGEQVAILADGSLQRSSASRSGEDWAWTGKIVPAFDIDERPLADFLQWVSRETGRELRFASAGARDAANSVILSGSVAGLTPERALNAVLMTTRLQYTEKPGALVIEVKSGGG